MQPENERQVEMPHPTVAPLVVAVGITMFAVGVVLGPVFVTAGVGIFVAGMIAWIRALLPGVGHGHETVQELPAPVAARSGMVAHLRPGMPGYRLRLPVEVHPISAGLKGGIIGGVIMPIPALLYGVLSGRGIWYPVNLLAGMVLPGVDELPDLGEFHASLFLIGVGIHAVVSAILGLLYGVLLPTLPEVPQPFAWGGLLMPMLWTAVTFPLLGYINPLLHAYVDWPWFIASQFAFGLAAAATVVYLAGPPRTLAGLAGGVVGGLIMPLPAVLWSLFTGHSIWYPLNLLAGMFPHGESVTQIDLEQFRPSWFAAGVSVHLLMSISFGLIYGVLLGRLPRIPGPMAWGALLLPLFWTATSYGLMGVVNPVLQERVDWPWFIASQFVFGLAASIVVVRSEKIAVPPAGTGE